MHNTSRMFNLEKTQKGCCSLSEELKVYHVERGHLCLLRPHRVVQ